MSASADYDAKRGYVIDVMDPGAVPGGSTRVHRVEDMSFVNSGGAETGSTCVLKVSGGVRTLSTVIGLYDSCK